MFFQGPGPGIIRFSLAKQSVENFVMIDNDATNPSIIWVPRQGLYYYASTNANFDTIQVYSVNEHSTSPSPILLFEITAAPFLHGPGLIYDAKQENLILPVTITNPDHKKKNEEIFAFYIYNLNSHKGMYQNFDHPIRDMVLLKGNLYGMFWESLIPSSNITFGLLNWNTNSDVYELANPRRVSSEYTVVCDAFELLGLVFVGKKR